MRNNKPEICQTLPLPCHLEALFSEQIRRQEASESTSDAHHFFLCAHSSISSTDGSNQHAWARLPASCQLTYRDVLSFHNGKLLFGTYMHYSELIFH